MHELATELFPITRSITGAGVRQTLSRIAELLPGLVIHEVPSGTEVLDWTVPREWEINEARLTGPTGEVIADLTDSNIHVLNYAAGIDVKIELSELQEHLHSLPDMPQAIPYVTSYYADNWGFCITDDARQALGEGRYHAFIDSRHVEGSLTYGELLIPGESAQEVLISTYVCHPSLGNNELSGPVVTVALARWLMQQESLRFSYRIVFAPETIGAITYIATHRDQLSDRTLGGINLTCIGDDGDWSYLASREGNHPLDRIAKRVVQRFAQPKVYSYLDRGSDERHYGMPGVDVPMISLMRTKYGAYPEYHTSLDDLSVITPSGLQGGLDLVRQTIKDLESSRYFVTTVLGEPQLGKRGLYHRTHARTVSDVILARTHVLAYSDGQHSIEDLAELLDLPDTAVDELVSELLEHGLLTETLPLKRSL
jgi:aminopeptidase-like protein